MKKTAHHESKSLKTFYLYTFAVLILICVSLAIKLVFIYQQSKFNPSHDFILAIVQQKSVREIVAFHPQTPAVSFLLIQDKSIPYSSLAKVYGIATDGYISTQDNKNVGTDIAPFLWSSLLYTTTWQSNLTALDKLRLMFLAKNVSTNNKTSEPISLITQTPDTNTIIATALTDQDLASENISVQIINATDVSGLGQRLGRVLTNMGADVVDVSSGRNTQERSSIAYYGNESYTVDRLQKYFGVQAGHLTRQTIADIVITIGDDKRDTTAF